MVKRIFIILLFITSISFAQKNNIGHGKILIVYITGSLANTENNTELQLKIANLLDESSDDFTYQITEANNYVKLNAKVIFKGAVKFEEILNDENFLNMIEVIKNEFRQHNFRYEFKSSSYKNDLQIIKESKFNRTSSR